MTLVDLLARVAPRGEITADDALAARRAVYEEGAKVNRAAAAAIFALNDAARVQAPEWRTLFCEVILDFVVRQADPPGYVDDARADWLMAAVFRDRVLRADELETLLEVLELSDKTPVRLSRWVLRLLLEQAHAGLDAGKSLTARDVERLRRAVFACGSEGDVGVTRSEAEALVDLNDALKGRPTDPAWPDFFARAVGNAVLFQPTWRPEAAAERAREAWLQDPGASRPRSGRDWSGGFVEGLREVAGLDFVEHDMERAVLANEATEAWAEQITAEKAAWLRGLVQRDGEIDAAGRSLLAFVAREARSLDPALRAFIVEAGVSPADAPRDRLAAAPAARRPQAFGRRGFATGHGA